VPPSLLAKVQCRILADIAKKIKIDVREKKKDPFYGVEAREGGDWARLGHMLRRRRVVVRGTFFTESLQSFLITKGVGESLEYLFKDIVVMHRRGKATALIACKLCVHYIAQIDHEAVITSDFVNNKLIMAELVRKHGFHLIAIMPERSDHKHVSPPFDRSFVVK